MTEDRSLGRRGAGRRHPGVRLRAARAGARVDRRGRLPLREPRRRWPAVTINPGETVTLQLPRRRELPQRELHEGAADVLHADGRRRRSGPAAAREPFGAGLERHLHLQRRGHLRVRLRARLHARRGLVVPVGATPTPTPSTTATPTPRTPTATPTATARHRPRPDDRDRGAAVDRRAHPPRRPRPAQPTGPAAGRLMLARTPARSGRQGLGRRRPGGLTPARRCPAQAQTRRNRDALPSTRAAPPSRSSSTRARSGRSSAAARLALTVRITVTPPAGSAFTETRKVTLRR